MRKRLGTGRTATLALLAAGALALTGCSSEVDGGDIAEEIQSRLSEQMPQPPKSVDCPDNLKAEEGATIECTLVTADDVSYGVTVEATAVDGDNVEYSFEVDSEPQQ
jgi:Domain of unknown function (DUF4333)